MNLARRVGVVLFLLAVSTGRVYGEIPQELAWQGVVLDSNNVPLSDGVYTFHFGIFSDDVGGTPLWDESQAVTVQSGVLNVLLGKLNPIPDSAFSGPARFLQVQFEDQAPYEPRTRIVSVGYAYRTASVDGALAGQLAGDLAVTGGVQASALTVAVPEEALESVALGSVAAHLQPDGGVVELFDEANSVLVYAGPDPNGTGGQISVSSNPLGTTGILLEGNSDNSMEPRLAIVGSQAALNFDLKPGGDISLVLPPGTITSDQIKDESGLASGVQPGAVLDIEDSYRSLASATATFPADGYAMVIAESTFRGQCTESWLDGRLLDNTEPAANWYWDPGDFDQWYDQRQTYVHASAVDSGTHTFELQIRQTRGRTDAVDARVTILFVPTNYGLIATSVDAGAGGAADSTQVEPVDVADIDVNEERTSSVAANQARIEEELQAMAERLSVLQAELARARSLPGTEP